MPLFQSTKKHLALLPTCSQEPRCYKFIFTRLANRFVSHGKQLIGLAFKYLNYGHSTGSELVCQIKIKYFAFFKRYALKTARIGGG